MGQIPSLPQTSLRKKIGQMLILGFEGKAVNQDSEIIKEIDRNNLGGVILFDFSFKTKNFDKNIENPKQVQQLNNDLQAFNSQAHKKNHRPNLPLLISVDYEGGKVDRLSSAYGFPNTITAKQCGQLKPAEAQQQANKMARTLKASGFNLNFAPVVDLDINPQNPIIGQLERSYSADPSLVAIYAQAFAAAMTQNHILCCYKHFPGHGSSTKDSHLGFVDVTDPWQPFELEPYRQIALDSTHSSIIMSAHIVNRNLDSSGLPATLSKAILTDLLRAKLGFKGLICTDDMQMKAISGHYGVEKAVTMAINAGADLLVFGNQLTEQPQSSTLLIDIIEHQVQQSRISEQRINDAYARIIALKQNLI